MSNTASTEADRAAKAKLDGLIMEFQSLTGTVVNRVGDWSTGFVVNVGKDVFSVQPTPDGVRIEPRERTPLSLAYARDTMALLNFWRKMESSATILGKIQGVSGGAPTLATSILDAAIERQTRQAMGSIGTSNSGRWGG